MMDLDHGRAEVNCYMVRCVTVTRYGEGGVTDSLGNLIVCELFAFEGMRVGIGR